jgi:hypothetical protein
MVVCCISSTSAVIYDLNRDISDSQNINQTGGTTTVPASVPLILSDTTSRVKTGSTTTSVTVEDGVEAEGTNPIDQLPELERDAEFLMSLRWLYEQ